jgi:hypothetical protein
MKQTAVDWLINEIDMQYPEINVRRKEWMVDKAKQMEKEQIEYAFEEGYNDGCFYMCGSKKSFENSEEYYKETYEQDDNI